MKSIVITDLKNKLLFRFYRQFILFCLHFLISFICFTSRPGPINHSVASSTTSTTSTTSTYSTTSSATTGSPVTDTSSTGTTNSFDLLTEDWVNATSAAVAEPLAYLSYMPYPECPILKVYYTTAWGRQVSAKSLVC